MQEIFEIGKIVNTSGLKGFVKANLYTDDITKIEEFNKVLIEKNDELIEYEIEEVRYHKNQALIKFKSIDSIEKAESLRNCSIKIHRDDEKKLPKDTFYIVDLIGLDVYTDENVKLGNIKDVFSVPSGSNDVYVVQTKGKDILLPAIGDVVKDINLKENKMIVHLIDGLV